MRRTRGREVAKKLIAGWVPIFECNQSNKGDLSYFIRVAYAWHNTQVTYPDWARQRNTRYPKNLKKKERQMLNTHILKDIDICSGLVGF